MRTSSRADRILAFDVTETWHPTPRKAVRVAPLPWIPSGDWNATERVCLGLTSHGTTAFFSSVSLLRLVMTDRAITGPLFEEGPLVHSNRGVVVEAFLARPDLGEFLLCIDVDTIVEATVGRALVTVAKDLELDVVSQSYPTLSGGCEACLLNEASPGRVENVEEPAWGTVVPVDFVGFGCVLLRRRFLVEMQEELRDEGPDALFAPMPDFPSWGEDYAFCARARDLGARIATANVARVRHLKTAPLALRSQAHLPALQFEPKEA